mmetsp:Transcript_22922/g.26952  ORF Transcript_22922/g.26952 Transcript_22922/m.26952 type:complete len:239 (+) Transcript_22922:23-739(+)
MANAKVVVFGGNGFVGSNILKELCLKSIPAISVSRSGLKPKYLASAGWDNSSIIWHKGDALEPRTYTSVLTEDVKAVVISIGSPPVPFVDESYQIMMNGGTNCTIIEAAREAGIKKVVLINASMPDWAAAGYRKGKLQAESCAKEFVKNDPTRSSLVLKPGAIYGTRYTQSGIPIPLTPILGPLSFALKSLPGGVSGFLEGVGVLAPTHVDVLAKVAVDFIDSETETGFVVKDTSQLI